MELYEDGAPGCGRLGCLRPTLRSKTAKDEAPKHFAPVKGGHQARLFSVVSGSREECGRAFVRGPP